MESVPDTASILSDESECFENNKELLKTTVRSIIQVSVPIIKQMLKSNPESLDLRSQIQELKTKIQSKDKTNSELESKIKELEGDNQAKKEYIIRTNKLCKEKIQSLVKEHEENFTTLNREMKEDHEKRMVEQNRQHENSLKRKRDECESLQKKYQLLDGQKKMLVTQLSVNEHKLNEVKKILN